MIRIRKPLHFSEIGRKDNQEDYLFPTQADVNSRVFIMCDGMGGHDNGEVASMTAANALGKYLISCPKIDIATFETGLAKAYDALDGIDTDSSKKPGTTMTCLCLNSDSYLVAHIGDSRIYHIRPSLYDIKSHRGGILYQSSDHSLVNDLLKAGELTEETASNFPHKNIITRAMQPHLAKRYRADIYMFDDIRAGDYFFLCCDGILEQLSNEGLCHILSDATLNDEQKIAAIKNICDGNTNDNYSCWLIPIDSVSINMESNVSHIIKAGIESDDSHVTRAAHASKRLSYRTLCWIIGLLTLLLALCFGFIIYTSFFKDNHEEEQTSPVSLTTHNYTLKLLIPSTIGSPGCLF